MSAGKPDCKICEGVGFVDLLDMWTMQEEYDPRVGLAAYETIDTMPMIKDCPCGFCREDEHNAYMLELIARRGQPYAPEESP